MRIGISTPFKDGGDRPLNAAGIAARAAMVEQAGLNGVWIQDGPDALPGLPATTATEGAAQ